MQAKEVARRVWALAEPICAQESVLLWDVEFEKEGAQYMLTVTIDKPESAVDIAECEAVSRALDPLLDDAAFDSLPSYTLCVSSAGLSRRLRRPMHFEQCMGKQIELKFYKPIHGAKNAQGALESYDEDTGNVTIQLDDGALLMLEPSELADVRLAVSI